MFAPSDFAIRSLTSFSNFLTPERLLELLPIILVWVVFGLLFLDRHRVRVPTSDRFHDGKAAAAGTRMVRHHTQVSDL